MHVSLGARRSAPNLEGPDQLNLIHEPRPYPAQASLHRDLVAFDIAGFGKPERDELVQLYVRDALYRIVPHAFDSSGIGWRSCHHEDRGDGMLIVISPHVPTAALIDPLVDLLRAGIRSHNRLSCPSAAIGLRMAVHGGHVHYDPYGLAGDAIVHLFRLLDAAQLKDALAITGAELSLIVSSYVHDTVIRNGPGLIDPASYHPVEVNTKQAHARAWVHIPGRRPAVPGGIDIVPDGARFN